MIRRALIHGVVLVTAACCLIYHGSEAALAAVRWQQWKLQLSPGLALYDLAADPGETNPVRNGAITRKLRGMVVLFQEEMSRHARPAGRVDPAEPTNPANR